jgi:outer membrane protein OmpA-like peptidoglycan-associated protein
MTSDIPKRFVLARYATSLATVALVAALTACGSGSHPSSPASPSPAGGMSTASTAIASGTPDANQLAVSEQPWWQRPPAAPTPTVSSGTPPPRQRITLALPGDVLFEPDSARLTLGAATQLAALQQQYLAGHPGATLTVTGHTEFGAGRGTEAALSSRRAAAVRDWLTAHGTPQASITIRGVGGTEPLYPNDTPSHQADNRRCDISITW